MVILKLIHVPLDVVQDTGQAPGNVIHCRQHRIRHLPVEGEWKENDRKAR